MHIFFTNPEPSFLVGDRMKTNCTDPVDHASFAEIDCKTITPQPTLSAPSSCFK